jgi:hypothetical protein
MSRRILQITIMIMYGNIVDIIYLIISIQFQVTPPSAFQIESVATSIQHRCDRIVIEAIILLTMRSVKVGCSSLSAVRKIAVQQRREVHTNKLLNACASTENYLSELFQFS